MNDRELIENCCDELAFDNLDIVNGELTEEQINKAIDNASKKANVDLTLFLTVFKTLFFCDPYTYVKNIQEDNLKGEARCVS